MKAHITGDHNYPSMGAKVKPMESFTVEFNRRVKNRGSYFEILGKVSALFERNRRLKCYFLCRFGDKSCFLIAEKHIWYLKQILNVFEYFSSYMETKLVGGLVQWIVVLLSLFINAYAFPRSQLKVHNVLWIFNCQRNQCCKLAVLRKTKLKGRKEIRDDGIHCILSFSINTPNGLMCVCSWQWLSMELFCYIMPSSFSLSQWV